MGLPLFIVPGRQFKNRPGSDAEDIVSSSEALMEYLRNLQGLEISDEVNWQMKLIQEALAANYIRGMFTPRWSR